MSLTNDQIEALVTALTVRVTSLESRHSAEISSETEIAAAAAAKTQYESDKYDLMMARRERGDII